MQIDIPGDGDAASVALRPLAALTSRDSSDPAIALMDGWATIADVLTFYQERIANESFLRTATERASLVALGRTVGYTPRPGIAATTFLSYTIDAMQTEPVVIPAGTRAQSVPGPGELPQSFETTEPIEARAEWNALPVRTTRPPHITLATSLRMNQVPLKGSPVLRPGDMLLFLFDHSGEHATTRTVSSVTAPTGTSGTIANLVPIPPLVIAALPLLEKFVAALRNLPQDPDMRYDRYIARSADLLRTIMLGGATKPQAWIAAIADDNGDDVPDELSPLVELFDAGLKDIEKNLPVQTSPASATPDQFISSLLIRPAAQAASAERLSRDLTSSFSTGRDAAAQLLLDVVPAVRSSFYTAWANAQVATADPPLKALHVFRSSTAPFGANAPFVQKYDDGELQPPDKWTDWYIDADESDDVLFLETAHDAVVPESFALTISRTSRFISRQLNRIVSSETVSRSAYGLAGRTTRLTFAKDWWDSDRRLMSTIRATSVRVQSEPLELAAQEIEGSFCGNEVELAVLSRDLQPGRWLVISGERADIPGVSGVEGRELAMLAGLTHGFDAGLPGDTNHTTLMLATKPAYSYKRNTVVINANVARATHGEARIEVLGSGDATRAYQSFDLKQSPVTFTASAGVTGTVSSLRVFVDDVEWREAATLVGRAPADRMFVTRTSAEGTVTATFGDGTTGARLPTGVENVRAEYRQGIGRVGNVQAGQISLLMSRPAGVRSVTNPLASTGGADPDAEKAIRENVPLSAAAMDRVVSVRDYADFSRTFAGISKADAREVSDGIRRHVHVTVAGVDDASVDTTSELYRALLLTLRQLGDPSLPVLLAERERITLVIAAGIRLLPMYQWEPVVAAVRQCLLDRFSFAAQSLGQPVTASSVIAAIQNVPGVDYVDVDAFGGVPDRQAMPVGSSRLMTLDEISAAVAAATTAGACLQRLVPAAVAGFRDGTIRPAQLAFFTPAVPETISLTQIS